MKKFLSILILCLGSHFAYASAAGSWLGWIYWSFDGSPTRCEAKMKFTQTSETFERSSGFLDCNVVTMEMDPKAWALKDGQMYEDGKSIGIYEDNHYHWIENYSPTVQIETDVLVSGGHLDYVENWTKKLDQSSIYHLEGRLFLEP